MKPIARDEATLRDKFAMSAPSCPYNQQQLPADVAKADAEWRYLHADAMIEERKKRRTTNIPERSRNNEH